jgi:hypothetical protein
MNDSLRKKLFACVLLFSGAAWGDGWPASVAGVWSIVGNQSAGTLSLVQFAGAAGSQCKPVRGVIYGLDDVEGFYCPASGRLAFIRYLRQTLQPRQFWTANLSQAFAGVPLRLGGSFAAFDHDNVSGTSGGSLGEYNFHGTK